MVKIVVNIDGMKTAFCELCIENEIKENFKVRKVNASREKNNAVIISDEDIKSEYLRNVIDKAGYVVLGIEKKEVVKRLCFYKEV